MNARKSLWLIPAVLMAAVPAVPGQVEEMVAVPRSRLQELERKEVELERLKAELGRAQSQREQLENEQQRLKEETARLTQAKAAAEEKAAAAANAEPVIRRDTPPMTALSPLQKGEVVDAMDLMNHYRADALAAQKRYETHPIRVQGEVVAFEKPMFVSYYVICLKTTERDWKVACRVDPPENYSATFIVQGGDELVGSTRAGLRRTLARVGQQVVIDGRCRGLRDRRVTLSGCALAAAR